MILGKCCSSVTSRHSSIHLNEMTNLNNKTHSVHAGQQGYISSTDNCSIINCMINIHFENQHATTSENKNSWSSTEESFNSCWPRQCVEFIFVKAAARDGYDSQQSSAWIPNMQTNFFQLNFLVINYFLKVKLSFRLNCFKIVKLVQL